MPVESWIRPDDVPALAAEAMARIDAALSRLDEAGRQAFWSSIRKCYNTPYNDPKPRKLVRSEGLGASLSRPAAAPIPPCEADIASLMAITPPGFSPGHHAV